MNNISTSDKQLAIDGSRVIVSMLTSMRTVPWLIPKAGTPSSMGSSQSRLARVSGPDKGVGTGYKRLVEEWGDKSISLEVWLEQNQDRKGIMLT